MLKRLARAFTRLLIIAAVIGGVLLLIRQTTLSRQEQRREELQAGILDQTTPTVGELRVSVSATGSVLPNRQVPLLFEGSGVVREVLVRQGERVSAGQVIARLDSADLEAALQEAEIALEAQILAYEALIAPPRAEDRAVAEASLNAALASLNAAAAPTNPSGPQIAALQSEIARNRLWQAQLQRDIAVTTDTSFSLNLGALIPEDVEIPQEVIDGITGAISGLLPSLPASRPEDFAGGLALAEGSIGIAEANAQAAASRGTNQGAVASANAAVVAARETLRRLDNGASQRDLQLAEMGILIAQTAVDQARAAVSRAELVAPFDGVIATLDLRQGQLAPTNRPAALLIDDSALVLDLAVDETDVGTILREQPVELRFDALPDTRLSGRITRIAEAPTVIGQLVTYPVRVTLNPTEMPVRIGMSATATVIVDSVADALTLPNRFIRIDRISGDAFVTVENAAGRYEEVRVAIGLRNETTSQILSGVEAGQTVILRARATFDPLN